MIASTNSYKRSEASLQTLPMYVCTQVQLSISRTVLSAFTATFHHLLGEVLLLQNKDTVSWSYSESDEPTIDSSKSVKPTTNPIRGEREVDPNVGYNLHLLTVGLLSVLTLDYHIPKLGIPTQVSAWSGSQSWLSSAFLITTRYCPKYISQNERCLLQVFSESGVKWDMGDKYVRKIVPGEE